VFDLPELQFPPQLNCGVELLDKAIARGWGDRACIVGPGLRWTYADLQRRADAIAHVLVQDMGVLPGQRVLLRAPNNAMLAACWFGVMKTGAVAVATMPLLRAKELKQVVAKGQVTHALCDQSLAEELALAQPHCPTLREVRLFNDASSDGLEAAMARHARPFTAVDTAADDTCLLAFTSGTTGEPKATMHFHQDVMAICACWPAHVLRANADDVFIGSPPLGFTFGLGGLLLFPLAIGASTVLLEKATPPLLLEAIAHYGATVLFTAPTTYRAIAEQARVRRLSVALGGTLRKCVSAGEALPAATRVQWKAATGIEAIDGIGSTEMLHIFLSNRPGAVRYGVTGRPIPGFEVKLLDEAGHPVPRGEMGELHVKGPTSAAGYWDKRDKTRETFLGAWTRCADKFVETEDGDFVFCGRSDDMLKVGGIYVSPAEVEAAIMTYPAVIEAAVVGRADPAGLIKPEAFVVVRDNAPETIAADIQAHVKTRLAPYKYPRWVNVVDELPKTPTGKLKRYLLRG